MKRIVASVAFVIWLSTSGSVWSQTSVGSSRAMSEPGRSSTGAYATKRLSDREIGQMSAQLCSILSNTRTNVGYPVAQHLDSRLRVYAEISDDDPNARKKLAIFWNAHAEWMICPSLSGFYPRQHFYKRAIEMRNHPLVLTDYFFKDPDEFPVDANVIEVLENGEGSTMIDYIVSAKELPNTENRYNWDSLEEFMDYVIDDFGAKSVSEMDPEEKALRIERGRRVCQPEYCS